MTMSGPVTIAREQGVATITVDNPPANALTDATLEALGDAAAQLATDPGIRAAVITGTGKRAFIAGADLRGFAQILGDRAAMQEHVGLTRPVFEAWARLEVPLVAALNAHAMGGGLELALLCDFIVTDPAARVGLPEVTLGLIPGAGGTQRLISKVGLGAARELALLGSPLDAAGAHRIGLVDRVADPGEVVAEAKSLADELAARPAVAVRAVKLALRAAVEPGLADGLDSERALFLDVAESDDAREGVEAFLAGRPPVFTHS